MEVSWDIIWWTCMIIMLLVLVLFLLHLQDTVKVVAPEIRGYMDATYSADR